MKEMIIRENEAGQRFDKYLKKYLSQASGGFLYKMLRKKNIVLNGKKADGTEKLSAGDHVKLFLSEETIAAFSGRAKKPEQYKTSDRLEVVYEDSHVLILNKPAGMLSQRAGEKEDSAVEYVIGYLLEGGKLSSEELRTFRPSVCNRLDRNTSGLITAGKSLAGLQAMSALFHDRTMEKYYLCLVKGKITEPAYIRGYLRKNGRTNRVRVTDKPPCMKDKDRAETEKSKSRDGDYMPIETAYTAVAYSKELTLLKVHLITGRAHQIRAHLASEGHPVLGDYKYGDRKWNDGYKSRFGISAQLLHAYELVFPELGPPLAAISGQTFQAKVPTVFYRVIKEQTWEHGIQEALEVLH